MRLAPLHTDERSGKILLPSAHWLDEMRRQPYRHTLTIDPGFYHRYIVGGADFVDTQAALEKFRKRMRSAGVKKLELGWFDISGRFAVFGSLRPMPHAKEILYAVPGPIPARAMNGRWMPNMSMYRYNDEETVLEDTTVLPQLG